LVCPGDGSHGEIFSWISHYQEDQGLNNLNENSC
jgi:hypothetical protein